MMTRSFGRPVTVLVGLGMPVEIGTVMEAYALLDDWPPSQRNRAHTTALNACKAALMDLIEPETARATFEAFARRNDLLVEDGAVGVDRRDAVAALVLDTVDSSADPVELQLAVEVLRQQRLREQGQPSVPRKPHDGRPARCAHIG